MERIRNRAGFTPAEGCMVFAVVLFAVLLVALLVIAFFRFREPPGNLPPRPETAPATSDRRPASTEQRPATGWQLAAGSR